MSKSMKIELIRRLVARGEILCARVLCEDWNIDIERVVNDESKTKRK